MNKNYHAADMLLKYSSLVGLDTFKNVEVAINKIDWEEIESGDYTFSQLILIEVFRFLLTDSGNVQLEDLLALSETERQAVMLTLNEKFKVNSFEDI
jgi:hypothetical protein